MRLDSLPELNLVVDIEFAIQPGQLAAHGIGRYAQCDRDLAVAHAGGKEFGNDCLCRRQPLQSIAPARGAQ